ncbi:MAG: ribosome maturation factor RimP [Gemmatimonadota bacterium]|jgi:ribosome maturation factor RimP
MGREVPEITRELEARVGELGFEFVDVEWAGSARRPIVRLRVDRPDSVPGETGVTVDDCAVVSRGLEPWLDEHPAMPERYVLEVSSPGVDRPLVRDRDFDRFAGEQVAVKGRKGELLAERASRLEGTLLGLTERDGEVLVRLRLNNGDEVEVPRREIAGAHIVYSWD